MFIHLLFRTKDRFLYKVFPKTIDGYNSADILIENTLYYFNDKNIFTKKNFTIEMLSNEQTLNFKYPIASGKEKGLKELLDSFIGGKLNIIHSIKPRKRFFKKNRLSVMEPAIRALEKTGISVYHKSAVEYDISDVVLHVSLLFDYEKYFIEIFGLGGENKNKKGWSVIEYYDIQPSDYYKLMKKFNIVEVNSELHILLKNLSDDNLLYLEDILETKFHFSQLPASTIKIKFNIEKIKIIT